MAELGMLKRLEEVEKKYLEIERTLSKPDISPPEIHKYSKELSDLDEIVEVYRKYKSVLEKIEENRSLLKDKDLGELAKEELEELAPRGPVVRVLVQHRTVREFRLLRPPFVREGTRTRQPPGTGLGGEEAILRRGPHDFQPTRGTELR